MEGISTDLLDHLGFSRSSASSHNQPAEAELEGCRQYLLMIANEAIGPGLRAKFGASDAVQEAFLEAHRHIATYRGRTKVELRAWLRKILECRLANLRRGYHGTEKRAVSREVGLDVLIGPAARNIRLEAICSDPSPSEHAVRNESVADLERAVGSLPEHYRAAISLRHREQLTWEAMGERLGCSPDAARMLWGRAIRMLRQELGEA